MDLVGFCWNCFFNWYKDVVEEKGIDLFKEDVCEIVYGMFYVDWKIKYQIEVMFE